MIRINRLTKSFNILCKNYALFSINKSIFHGIAQSSYFSPVIKVEDFLKQRNISFLNGQSSFKIKQCLFCQQPHYNQYPNLYTLHVDKRDGKFLCQRCMKKGSWNQFRAKSLNLQQNSIKQLMSFQATSYTALAIQYQILANNLQSKEFEDVLSYVKSRGFTEQTIKKYMIGAGVETFVSELGKEVSVHVVYFPMFQFQINDQQNEQKEKDQKNQKGEQDKNRKLKLKISKIKVRGASTENKKYTRQYPSNPESGYFGLNTIKQTDKIIVITEGEFDAMAVHQQTGLPAISLPQGATSLPDKLIPMLNQFQKIILWMDNDDAGKLGAEKISYKLGHVRTYVVKNQIAQLKDANDYLKKSPEKIKQLIQKAKTKPGQNILTYVDLKDSVRNRVFNDDLFVGVQVDWLPFFNKKVKGIRMQELSIVSGPTGCGKTTFLAQISLDLCKKKIPVLWGSFQIRNQVLLTNMLIQYSGVNLYKSKMLFDHYADQFNNLPLHCLAFHGSNDIDKVLATIQYSIEKHNISFVVLDTLQFLLSDQAEGFKKFDLQDKVMSRLRRIATKYNVHIAIVIHPRKTDNNEDIQIHSIYGTSKAAQEADNIWMIQNRQNFRIFDIKKNRYDGQIGKVALGYNKELKTFIQLKMNQLQQLLNNESTIEQIIKLRGQLEQEKSLSKQNQLQNFTLDPQNQQNFNHEQIISNLNNGYRRRKKNI